MKDSFDNNLEQLRTTEEILEHNLLPAVVPLPISSGSVVITEQPKSNRSNSIATDYGTRKQQIEQGNRKESHHYRRNPHPSNPTGLACLAVADQILIEIKQSCCNCCCCNRNTKYQIKDEGSEESAIFSAEEELTCFSFGNLRNVVIRDREGVPVARACFKEKYCLFNSMVLAVYSPPESLIGTIEESPGCIMLSSKFVLRNSDGDDLFRIGYNGGLCSSFFNVTSIESKEEIAKILEKTKGKLRLKFLSKLSLTNKLILVGFCVGMIHKNMKQQETE